MLRTGHGISPGWPPISRMRTSSNFGSASLGVAVYRAEGQFYATQDLCTHEHAYLSDGVVVDCVVECPFHQGRFDIRTGKALGPPVIEPLETYPIKIVDGRLYVCVTKEQVEAGDRPQTGLAALKLKKDARS